MRKVYFKDILDHINRISINGMTMKGSREAKFDYLSTPIATPMKMMLEVKNVYIKGSLENNRLFQMS